MRTKPFKVTKDASQVITHLSPRPLNSERKGNFQQKIVKNHENSVPSSIPRWNPVVFEKHTELNETE